MKELLRVVLLGWDKMSCTNCLPSREDIIGIKVESDLISSGDLEVRITFPYGDSGMAGGVWDQEERHTTEAIIGKKDIAF